MNPKKTFILSSLVACLCIDSVHGATYHWTGASGSDFNSPANWVENAWTEWSDYVFGSDATNGSASIDATFGTHSLSLASGLGSDITIGSTGGSPPPIIMHGSSFINIDAASKNLTINSKLQSSAIMSWDIGSGRTFTLNGQLTNWAGQGVAAILKKGSGTAELTNTTNNYTGVTNITEGTLVAASNSALGAGGWSGTNLTRVSAGATLALRGGVSLNEHMHVAGAGVDGLGAIRSLSGNNALTLYNGGGASGPGYAIDSNTTIGVDADTLTITGFYQDGGSFGISKVGNGTLTLSSSSTYTGATTVNAGKLVIGTAGSLANTAVTVGGASATGTPTLAGGGTIAGATVIASAGLGVVGTHSPGVVGVSNGVGTQTFSSTLNYQAGSIFEWNMNAASTSDPGVVANATTGTYDQVVANGLAGSVTGTTSVFSVILSGNAYTHAFWDTNKSWTNIFSGTGTPVDLASIFTSFSNTNGLSGGDGTVIGEGQFTFTGSSLTWTAVPEPTSALAGLLLGAGLLRRRRSA